MLGEVQPISILDESLTHEEYEYVQQLKETYPKISLRDCLSRMKKLDQFKRLRDFNLVSFSILYYTHEEKTFFLKEDNIYKFYNSKDGHAALVEMAFNPEKFLKKNCYPFFEDRTGKSWTKSETDLIVSIANQAKDRSFLKLLALCFPGRSTNQVYTKYVELINEGSIKTDLRKIQKAKTQMPPIRKYFLSDNEEMLASEILVMFSEGSFISREVLRKKAKAFYMLPWVMAERATFQQFYRERRKIYQDEEARIYTDDFKRFAENLLKQIMPDGSKKPILSVQLKIIEDYCLPEPIFSNAWVRAFMKRNHFSFRLAHYSRRGLINSKFVDSFLNQLASAIIKYKWKRIYNMDETSIRINNGSLRTIAPIGVEKVVIQGSRNEKECFTSIATCSRYKKYPLIMLSKGKTEACCTKFRTSKNSEVWPSLKGWVDESVMIHYLEWFEENVSLGKPCALVLDCYRAHRTDLVKSEAEKRNIELIFVPACGTSIFQPLDRRIFGILKSHLRSLAGSKIFSGPGRYETVSLHLLQAWSRISDRALSGGWKIPGLEEKLKEKGYKEEEQDEEEENNIRQRYDDDSEEDELEDEEMLEEDEDINKDINEEEEEDFNEYDEEYEDKYY